MLLFFWMFFFLFLLEKKNHTISLLPSLIVISSFSRWDGFITPEGSYFHLACTNDSFLSSLVYLCFKISLLLKDKNGHRKLKWAQGNERQTAVAGRRWHNQTSPCCPKQTNKTHTHTHTHTRTHTHKSWSFLHCCFSLDKHTHSLWIYPFLNHIKSQPQCLNKRNMRGSHWAPTWGSGAQKNGQRVQR